MGWGIEGPSGRVHRADTVPPVTALPVFDFATFVAAFDAERRERGLGWYEFADELWQQSSELNAERADHPI
jgi:hypothetical protein